MERLTEKHWRNLDPWECCGQDNYCQRGCHDQGGCANGCVVPKIYCRLAAYEDTGFTPEEVATFPYRKEFAYADYMKELFPKMERAEELSAADREGRIIIPPCKIGDAVWVLHTGISANYLHVYQWRCVEISQSLSYGEMVESYTIDLLSFTVVFYGHDIGSTMFFSRSEAEAALKKRKEESNWQGTIIL